MESFPSAVDPAPSSALFKETSTGSPRARVDELTALNRTRSGEAQHATSKLRRANTVAQGGNQIRRNLEPKAKRERTATTAVRSRDSKERLRKDALQRSQTNRDPRPGPPAGRRAGHFTVGSVGQNGKIFLRPVVNPAQKAHRGSPPTFPPAQANNEPLQPQYPARDDPSRWSSSQLSELRALAREEKPEQSYEPAQPEYTSQRRRANSFSTISDKQSVSGADRRGELRIVIDRSEDRPKSADGKTGHAALEVPIPHYRLGTPRFNTEGSAILQSSVYTRTSVSDNFRNSTFLGGMVDPLPSRLPSPFGRDRDSFSRGHPSFAISMFSGTAAIDLGRASPVPRNSVVYELKGPVEPSIYETLVSDMDGGAVVRYIPGTKEISAATPARIVAQISSESFMDYELVSDFFLTFRSYLSTGHLLALLLARLQWAINRLQDDGRIIRIRTFAALRHWILNYFVDDFVTNYDLRARFCDTINSLYQEVKSRKHGGMSDLKILIDLKRCWNGKCSVFWPGPDFSNAYNDPDLDVAPGSTEVELPSDAFPPRRVAFPPSGPVLSVDTNVHEILPPPTQRDRNDSAATEQSIPFSTKSDQSTPALSCSLPPKSPKRQSVPLSSVKAPRPVQLGPNRSPASPHESPVSPILSRHHAFHGHGHKRSGSFSDSVRDDRVPMFAAEAGSAGSARQEVFDPIGLIRGELYPPAESYMTMTAPDSPPLVPPSTIATPDRRSIPDGASKLVTSNSGMRTILGSIKRALHTRNGGQSVSTRIANPSEAIAIPTRSKTSALPNNVIFGSELYRDRKAATVPKRPARIDLLCDEVLKQYRLRATMEEDIAQNIPHNPRNSGLQITVQEVSSNITEPNSPSTPVAGGSKTRSGLTTGSGSIVIVGGDTGLDIPAMSGAGPDSAACLESSHFLGSDECLSSERTLSQKSEQTDDHSLPPTQDDNEDQVLTPQRLSFFYPTRPITPRSHSTERTFTAHMRSSISLRLRKYASFQSGISRNGFSIGSEAGQSALSSSAPSEKPVGPPLRRRPGGNLRQMQTGDEPKTSSARGSMVSRHTLDGSVLDSNAPTENGDASRPQSTLIPPNPRYSLLHRGGARNLRRSFEAAIARFAQIPDDPDGGIESALLKLEGKWGDASSTEQGTREHREHLLTPSGAGKDVLARRPQTDKSGISTVAGRLAPPLPYSDSVAESEESYNSIPLLERGLTDESMKGPPTSQAPTIDTYGAPLSLISSRDTSELASHPSFQIIKETESIRRIPRGLTAPTSAPREVKRETPKRFSALSSDIDVIDSYDVAEARRSTGMHSLSESTVDIPPHPLAHPPSPPMTIQHPGSVISSSPLDNMLFQAQPLTPDTSPRRRHGENRSSRPRPVQHFSSDVLLISEKNHNMNPDHVPFILACESQVLAQQMTLVEMAALSEVDWRDLVELKWGNGSPNICNWVEFLREQRKGIDLVVGRFNLMVRWVLSEIVLTRDLHERARTITKYIHTAVHARRMCNYATMLQIAVALSSSDCTRLQQTWQLVPAEDRRLFKDMECLIQPVRNFHDLRVEMETANLQEGCIPFIGLYLHDLTYNAQKPAQVPSNAGGLLVNFERYRTTARIVKNLLRLIDASTKYRFELIQGIIERCLWVASLPEDEIQARSKELF